MNNQELAQVFDNIGDLLEIKGEIIYKVLAYRRAAESLRGFGQDVNVAWKAGKLRDIPGVGQAIAEKIDELLLTGKLEFYEKLKRDIPEGLIEVLAVPDVGPKKAALFWKKLNITTVAELAAAARAGKLRQLPGLGEKSEAKVLAGIESLARRAKGRWPLGQAWPLAQEILAFLRELPGVEQAEAAGSLRRMKSTIGDLDFLVAAKNAETVMAAFVGHPLVVRVLGQGPTKSSVEFSNGLQADLRVLPAARWGTLLQYFTGSKEHSVKLRELALRKGLSLSEHAFTSVTDPEQETLCATEAEVYRTLGLPLIPPELREDRGEIEAARANRLPHLIEIGDVRGNLHGHTDWSDGAASLEVMVAAARDLGHEYIAITDHSKTLGVAGGLDEERLRRQMAAIDALSATSPGIRVLKGIEVDILADGALDLDPDLLNELDVVVGSVHSHFRQDTETITARMIRAMESGCVDIIAHPTGRLIGHRDPYAVDVERLIDAAVATKTALEINANPERLDLNDVNARRARDRGALISINTDAHHPSNFNLLLYGVASARRAWLEAGDILNTWPLDRLLAWLKDRQR